MGLEPHVPLFAAGSRLSNEPRKALQRLCAADGSVKDLTAAAVACYARGSGELEAAINPVTLEDLVCVRNALLLSSEDALILQLAVQGLDLPNAPTSAREFCQILHT